MYRRTRKARARAKWRPRREVPLDEQRPAPWAPPDLRRRITIEDFDGPEPAMHVIELHRTARIDSYRAVIDGRDWHPRIGWSRILDGMRRAMPRIASPRNFSP